MNRIFGCVSNQKYEKISSQEHILNINNWNIQNKNKEIIEKVYNNFAILENNLDVLEYQKFIFDNFGELINIYCKCLIELKMLNNNKNMFYNNKMVEYNLINIGQFIKYIKSEEYYQKIIIKIIEKIIQYIISQNEKFNELWNKYEPLILNRNIFICLFYDDSKIQEMVKDEILQDKFESFTIREIINEIINFGNTDYIIKNYLSICKKLKLHQDAIYDYVKKQLHNLNLTQINLLKLCYKEDNCRFKNLFFDKLSIIYNNKEDKSNFYVYIKESLTFNDYQEFIRERLPIIFNYKIIDDIYKKQEEIEKKLDLIMQKLSII